MSQGATSEGGETEIHDRGSPSRKMLYPSRESLNDRLPKHCCCSRRSFRLPSAPLLCSSPLRPFLGNPFYPEAGEEPRKTSPLRCRTSPRGPSPVTPRGNGSVRSRGVALEEVKNACHEAQCAKLAGRGEHISPEKPLIFSPLHGGSSGKSETSSDIKYTADVGLLCGKTLTGPPLARNSMRPRPPDTKNMTR